MFKFFKFIGVASLALVLLFPLKDGGSISDAAKNEIAQQVPYVMDILAARHPVRVGLLRSLLDDQGQLNNVAESYVRSSMDSGKGMNILDSYMVYYTILLDKDGMRSEMATNIEKQLGLIDDAPTTASNGQ